MKSFHTRMLDSQCFPHHWITKHIYCYWLSYIPSNITMKFNNYLIITLCNNKRQKPAHKHIHSHLLIEVMHYQTGVRKLNGEIKMYSLMTSVTESACSLDCKVSTASQKNLVSEILFTNIHFLSCCYFLSPIVSESKETERVLVALNFSESQL